MLKKDIRLWIWSVSCLATGIVIGDAANHTPNTTGLPKIDTRDDTTSPIA